MLWLSRATGTPSISAWARSMLTAISGESTRNGV
jgi:hypothetical protein